MPCEPDDPEAGPDLNRLRRDAVWDRRQKRFRRKEDLGGARLVLHWVHEDLTPEAKTLGEMIDVDDDDPEDFVQFEREEMDSAELWERVIADLIEIEKRTGGRDKSPTTAIIETCLKTRGALGRK